MDNIADLWKRYTQDGDRGVREELILHYTPLVKYVVGRLGLGLPASLEQQDLISCGVMGLIDAVDRFQPVRGFKFETYAVPRIRGQIIDMMRGLNPLSRAAHRYAREIESAIGYLTQALGRIPDDSDVAEYLGVTVEEFRRRLVMSNSVMVSLDQPVGSPDGDQLDLHDSVEDNTMPTPSEETDRQDLLDTMVSAVQALPERERQMISLYYNDRLTMKEVGAVLGISESRVCQVHARALLTLRSLVSGGVTAAPVVYERRRIGATIYASAAV